VFIDATQMPYRPGTHEYIPNARHLPIRVRGGAAGDFVVRHRVGTRASLLGAVPEVFAKARYADGKTQRPSRTTRDFENLQAHSITSSALAGTDVARNI